VNRDDVLGGGFATPEEAAKGGAGGAGGAALSTSFSPGGEFAVVLLPVTAESLMLQRRSAAFQRAFADARYEQTQPQVVLTVRRGDRWHYVGGSIGNGVGWNSTSYRFWEEPPFKRVRGKNLGVVEYAARAPEGAAEVLVRWRGADHRVPVSSGWFLFTSWDVPDSWEEEDDEPFMTGYIGADGSVVPIPVDPEEATERAAERRHRREALDKFAHDWPYSVIDAIEPLEALNDDQRELLDELARDYPELREEPIVYWLRDSPKRAARAVVAPVSDELKPGDKVVCEGWSAAVQRVSLDETTGESSVVELHASGRLIPRRV
jgi:hypothetical protein